MSKIGTTWNSDDVEAWGQAEDMSAEASYGKLVELDSTEGRVRFTDATTEVVHGVIVELAKDSTAGSTVGVVPINSGKIAEVFVDGSGSAITVGARIGPSSTDGVGIVTTTDGHYVVGKALEAASAASVRISVALGFNQAAS